MDFKLNGTVTIEPLPVTYVPVPIIWIPDDLCRCRRCPCCGGRVGVAPYAPVPYVGDSIPWTPFTPPITWTGQFPNGTLVDVNY